MHWRSTARRDEMMVRVEERPWRGGTTVLLDHRSHAHSGSGPTPAWSGRCRSAASVCLHLHRYGHRIRLVVRGRQADRAGDADGIHSDHLVLDTLAALQASHQQEIAHRR